MTADGWTIVIPVKAPSRSKTRLAPHVSPAAREALAAAFAADTIDAARQARRVARVLVVAADPADAGSGEFVAEPPGAGLTEAVAHGIDRALASGAGDLAVLLGDLPSLRPDDLDAALDAAAGHPLAFVPDADETGTTLATALTGVPFAPRFGPESARRHRDAGFVELHPPVRLRRDVDTLAGLEAAIALGTGPRTAAVVAMLADGGAADDRAT